MTGYPHNVKVGDKLGAVYGETLMNQRGEIVSKTLELGKVYTVSSVELAPDCKEFVERIVFGIRGSDALWDSKLFRPIQSFKHDISIFKSIAENPFQLIQEPAE